MPQFLAKPLVMVVDDEPSQLRLTQYAIEEKLKLRSLPIQSGVQALAYLRDPNTPKPDLILLDYSMPQMNGLQVIEQLRPEFPSLPVVVLTMYGDLEKAVASVKAGANDFLAKPVNLERLRLTIHTHLRICKLERMMNEGSGSQAGPRAPSPMILSHSANVQAQISCFDTDGKLKTLEEVEKAMIETTLAYCDGNMTDAARALGIGRSTLYRKLARIPEDEEVGAGSNGSGAHDPSVRMAAWVQ